MDDRGDRELLDELEDLELREELDRLEELELREPRLELELELELELSELDESSFRGAMLTPSSVGRKQSNSTSEFCRVL